MKYCFIGIIKGIENTAKKELQKCETKHTVPYLQTVMYFH